ncbi:MAG: Capsular polysaccharide export system protein KpsS [uncultured Sulfurovum sp.]|uniref:Capsular polysaccharide export system protein KpsS n=1 Tax=uncultured Sulfurovum sp. TaxID=269237 RepID=A0A6S6SEG8_9BACT|nr:MAG: Capsular polysaccharide export system protein KpsS [uncultured Sulfurovum sp.]
MNSIGNIVNKNILLFQGPIGFFFKKLDAQFRLRGARTFRIGLNAGDEFFSYHDNYTGYKGYQKDWHTFIKTYLLEHQIDKVFLFGDCRFYQRILVHIAEVLNIEIFVFEEGYVRPHYITLERYGVNDYSHIIRHKNFYEFLEPIELKAVKHSEFSSLRLWSTVVVYYFIAKLFHFKYKHYQHHRSFSAIKEFFIGIKALVRKVIYTQKDKKYLKQIKTHYSKQYFFVPLQTHNDFQILQHSNYGTIEHFILEVLGSFAQYANSHFRLMFKHHPLDRGRKNYTKFIMKEAKKLKIEKRIIVVHDLHLPSCLRNAKGTVTINSTVGLSSLYHGTATITLGNAIYNIESLTNKDKSLNDFWDNPEVPDRDLFTKFRNYLVKTTQLNGSFYGRMPDELK